MLIVNRLDKKEVLDLISKEKLKRIFLDIDYTVLTTGKGTDETVNILNKIYPKLGDTADYIYKIILESKANFENMDKERQNEFLEIKNNFEEYQKDLKVLKIWSRESIIMEAAKRLNLKLSAKKIDEIADKYWQIVAELTEFYDDAIPLLDRIKKEKIPITWVTGSDSSLKLEEVNGEIKSIYDWEYSWKNKEKRLKILTNRYPGKLMIGDPIDKPELWNKLLDKEILKEKEKHLVIGDSKNDDLVVAESLGIKTILIKRK